jgi:hypothetical protein
LSSKQTPKTVFAFAAAATTMPSLLELTAEELMQKGVAPVKRDYIMPFITRKQMEAVSSSATAAETGSVAATKKSKGQIKRVRLHMHCLELTSCLLFCCGVLPVLLLLLLLLLLCHMLLHLSASLNYASRVVYSANICMTHCLGAAAMLLHSYLQPVFGWVPESWPSFS